MRFWTQKAPERVTSEARNQSRLTTVRYALHELFFAHQARRAWVYCEQFFLTLKVDSTLSICCGLTLGQHFPVQFRESRCNCVEILLSAAVGLIVLAGKIPCMDVLAMV